jgi:mRNA interferase MazF
VAAEQGRFRVWDIVKVPFPYADRPVRHFRPALVIAVPKLQTKFGVIWVLMITSAENRSWPGDVPILDPSAAGLPSASVVRTEKIATIDTAGVERIGVLPHNLRDQVRSCLQATLAAARFQ